ncbi:hypothetical protein DERP_015348 [Dermatophagoides pteronyssinus]|uniref:Uncharacterized protein n=1 Tax=Dermatophagoides pteronyssinus TaxID=6956 RepID=A0ABQ8JFK5_DERPT|nr:hypothetical protein DERP_015348 [Dermatophagoides pteronyssinus]
MVQSDRFERSEKALIGRKWFIWIALKDRKRRSLDENGSIGSLRKIGKGAHWTKMVKLDRFERSEKALIGRKWFIWIALKDRKRRSLDENGSIGSLRKIGKGAHWTKMVHLDRFERSEKALIGRKWFIWIALKDRKRRSLDENGSFGSLRKS